MAETDIWRDFKYIPHKYNFSFASNTTYGCGGTAKAAFFPVCEDDAARLYFALKRSGEKFCILGCGSDTLAQDGFYDGYVLSTIRLSGIAETQTVYDGTVAISVSGGTKVYELLAYCKRRGLTGAEFLAGIPASVGGLAFMNGGADGKCMQDIVRSVKIADKNVRVLTAEECNFTYKHSTMRDITCLILEVKLLLKRSVPSVVAANIARRLIERRKLPAGRSCGCVFENYCGVSAGKIIENAGLKGLKMGGAYVSPAHANFIINCGKSSADVYALIAKVKDEVYKKYGITLKEEVCYIGDFK